MTGFTPRPLITLLSLLVIGCGDKPSESRPDLINGLRARAGLIPGVVHLYLGCTATKINDHTFITAAHCLYEPETDRLRDSFSQGDFWVSSSMAPEPTTDHYTNLGVWGHRIHPTYSSARHGCSGTDCNGFAAKSYDIAVVLTSRPSDGIASLPVYWGWFPPGVGVASAGYGCEMWVGGPRPTQIRLTYGDGYVVSPDELADYDNYPSARDRGDIDFHNILTNGMLHSNPGISLCPGDSGGPLLWVDERGQIYLAGVHSYYAFPPDQGISYLNWHTRLTDLYTWVRDIDRLAPR